MRLYLDLKKAVGQVSSTGIAAKEEDQEVVDHENSYTKRYAGAAAGHEASHDDGDVGQKWHGDGESHDEATESTRQEKQKKAEKRNMVPAETKKSQEGTDIMKAMSLGLEEAYTASLPSDLETEFLVVAKGLPYDEVVKGLHWIAGRDRDLFHQWVCDRMAKSINDLVRRVL